MINKGGIVDFENHKVYTKWTKDSHSIDKLDKNKLKERQFRQTSRAASLLRGLIIGEGCYEIMESKKV